MTTAAPSAALATIQPAFTDAERLALAGFLAGYRGLTREAYALDLRQFTSWCRSRSVALFSVRRADIEGFARELEAAGRARATVTRRLSTIAGFCKYAVEEELLDRSPAAHVRRPRVDYESHAVALDRNELGALLVAAGFGPPAVHALISLLALNGLRVSEATGADIEHLGLERGHRTLTVTRNGGKIVTIPLAPRTARAVDLAIGERAEGPVFLARDGRRLDRHGAGRIVRTTARRAGIGKQITPTRCGTLSLPPHSTQECRCVMSRKPPRIRTRGPLCGMTGLESATRQLVQLSLHYLVNQPARICTADQQTPLPDARAIGDGRVVTFFSPLIEKLKRDGGNLPGAYPRTTETGAGTQQRDAYWGWFAQHWNADEAVKVVEDVIGDGGRPRWIDYRMAFGTGQELHLHVVARGDYDTGVFAYGIIRRGERFGLRIVRCQRGLRVDSA